MMWVAQGCLSMIQIVSVRYMKVFPCCDRLKKKWRVMIHIINGTIVVMITLVMGIL